MKPARINLPLAAAARALQLSPPDPPQQVDLERVAFTADLTDYVARAGSITDVFTGSANVNAAGTFTVSISFTGDEVAGGALVKAIDVYTAVGATIANLAGAAILYAARPGGGQAMVWGIGPAAMFYQVQADAAFIHLVPVGGYPIYPVWVPPGSVFTLSARATGNVGNVFMAVVAAYSNGAPLK